MNKADLIDRVASRLNESKAKATVAVEAVLAAIAEGVQQDGRVTISGFGAFERRQRAGRIGVNPATKERIQIDPSVTVTFRASPIMKEKL